jgi:hypothetical protein
MMIPSLRLGHPGRTPLDPGLGPAPLITRGASFHLGFLPGLASRGIMMRAKKTALWLSLLSPACQRGPARPGPPRLRKSESTRMTPVTPQSNATGSAVRLNAGPGIAASGQRTGRHLSSLRLRVPAAYGRAGHRPRPEGGPGPALEPWAHPRLQRGGAGGPRLGSGPGRPPPAPGGTRGSVRRPSPSHCRLQSWLPDRM